MANVGDYKRTVEVIPIETPTFIPEREDTNPTIPQPKKEPAYDEHE